MARLSIFSCDTPALTIVKWLVIVFNIVFWFLGASSFCLGIYLYSKSRYAMFTEGQGLFGVSLLAGTGFAVLVIGFVGVVSAAWESRLLMAFFAVMALFVAVAYFTAGTWAFIQKEKLEKELKAHLNKTMAMYDQMYAYREVWNYVQLNHHCCGIEGWKDWKGSISSTLVPDSCCVHFSSRCGASAVPRGKFYSKGCFSAISKQEYYSLNVVGPFGIAAGAMQVPVTVLSFVLFRILSGFKKSYSANTVAVTI